MGLPGFDSVDRSINSCEDSGKPLKNKRQRENAFFPQSCYCSLIKVD